MNNNRTWEALSMRDRASFIKLALQNGYKDIKSIRDLYNNRNTFEDGGVKSNDSSPVFTRKNMPGYSQITIDRLNYNNAILDTIPATRRAALLSAEFHESNLDPNAVGDGGKALGLLQVHPNRRTNLYNQKGTEQQKTNNQSIAIMNALTGRDSNNTHWTHGGKGSGFNSWKDAQKTFYNSNSSLEEINRALNRGFIRPHDAATKTKERLKTAEHIYNILEGNKFADGGPEENYDYSDPGYQKAMAEAIERIKIKSLQNSLNREEPYLAGIKTTNMGSDELLEYYDLIEDNELIASQNKNDLIKKYPELLLTPVEVLPYINYSTQINSDPLYNSYSIAKDNSNYYKNFLNKYINCRPDGYTCANTTLHNTSSAAIEELGHERNKNITASNYLFYLNPEKYGYKEKNIWSIQPSDIVQVFNPKTGLPEHMMMFDSYDPNNPNNLLFNYSSGGIDKDAIRKKQPYIENWLLDNEFEDTVKAYEFVGTPQDSLLVAKRYFKNKALGGPLYNEDNPIEGFQGNPYIPVVRYKDGGGIHIKPSKRGTFTAAATKHHVGVQEFASKVLANKENYSSAMVKKANFAKNAKKFKH